jgi:tetratricopeptide (TPR) repeat protein
MKVLGLILSCALVLCWGQAGKSDVLVAAKKAFDAGQFQEAIELFRRVSDKSCDVSFFIGLAEFRLGNAVPAIRLFEESSACDSKYLAPRLALAEAYMSRGDVRRAEAAFRDVLSIDASDPAALRGLAAIYFHSQANDKVIPLLEKLVAQLPRDADALAQLGAAYAATSQYVEAEKTFVAALAAQPKHASASVGLANVYLKTNRAERGLASLEALVEFAPNAYEPLFLLGSAYSAAGRAAEATEALERASNLAPDEAEIWYQLATLYRRQAKPDLQKKALANFQAAKRKAELSKHVSVETSRAIEEATRLVQAGNLRQAALALEQALKQDGNDADLLYRVASLKFDLKEYANARLLVEKATMLAPSEWRYEYLLGLIQKDERQLASARRAFEAVLRLNPHAADAHNQLGDLALRGGDAAAAVEHFKRAVRLSPDDVAYQLNLSAATAAIRGTQ